MGIDLVLSVQVYLHPKKSQSHLKAGAKEVIISAPGNDDKTIVFGVNHSSLTQIIR